MSIAYFGGSVVTTDNSPGSKFALLFPLNPPSGVRLPSINLPPGKASTTPKLAELQAMYLLSPSTGNSIQIPPFESPVAGS